MLKKKPSNGCRYNVNVNHGPLQTIRSITYSWCVFVRGHRQWGTPAEGLITTWHCVFWKDLSMPLSHAHYIDWCNAVHGSPAVITSRQLHPLNWTPYNLECCLQQNEQEVQLAQCFHRGNNLQKTNKQKLTFENWEGPDVTAIWAGHSDLLILVVGWYR